jgi:hypothetical protein
MPFFSGVPIKQSSASKLIFFNWMRKLIFFYLSNLYIIAGFAEQGGLTAVSPTQVAHISFSRMAGISQPLLKIAHGAGVDAIAGNDTQAGELL